MFWTYFACVFFVFDDTIDLNMGLDRGTQALQNVNSGGIYHLCKKSYWLIKIYWNHIEMWKKKLSWKPSLEARAKGPGQAERSRNLSLILVSPCFTVGKLWPELGHGKAWGKSRFWCSRAIIWCLLDFWAIFWSDTLVMACKFSQPMRARSARSAT